MLHDTLLHDGIDTPAFDTYALESASHEEIKSVEQGENINKYP